MNGTIDTFSLLQFTGNATLRCRSACEVEIHTDLAKSGVYGRCSLSKFKKASTCHFFFAQANDAFDQHSATLLEETNFVKVSQRRDEVASKSISDPFSDRYQIKQRFGRL